MLYDCVRDRGGILLCSDNEIKDIADSPAVGNAQLNIEWQFQYQNSKKKSAHC